MILWRVTELDIRGTLAKICRKVTHDHSVDELARKKRLRALAILGTAFLDHGYPLDSVDNISTLLQGSAFGQVSLLEEAIPQGGWGVIGHRVVRCEASPGLALAPIVFSVPCHINIALTMTFL